MCCLMAAYPAFAEFTSIDLEVESIQMQPSRPKAGEPAITVAVVRNNGSQSIGSFDVSVSVRQNKKWVRSIQKIPVLSTLPRMGAGKSIPVEIGKFSEGDYQVAVMADPENKLNETNEENNVRTQDFHVSAANSTTYASYHV